MKKKSRVGVALGGGGVRSLAHVPALETIDACGITPSVMAGTSMGAIIGALYASGHSGKDIRNILEQHIIIRNDDFKAIYRKKSALLKWLNAVHLTMDGSGLFKADGFLRHLLKEIKVETFEELKIPLRVTATDYHTGDAVVFDKGDLFPALKASMSIPGIFVPVEHDGRILVDGGVVNNLPYNLLADKCDVTIAIDVTPVRKKKNAEAPNMIDATFGMFDILVAKITTAMIKDCPPDVYLRPELVGIRMLDFEKTEDVLSQAQPAMADFKSKLETALKTRRRGLIRFFTRQ